MLKTSPNTRGSRKRLHATLCAGLSSDRLGLFLTSVVPMFCNDPALKRTCETSFRGLSQKLQSCGVANCTHELAEASLALDSFLRTDPPPPAPILFETQSFMGLIMAVRKRLPSAKMHFLTALWLATSCEEIPSEQVGLALHRLGRTYAACRSYKEAQKLITNALEKYKLGKVSDDHCCVVEATALLHETTAAAQAMENEAERQPLPLKRLSFIEEEDCENLQKLLEEDSELLF